MDATDATGLVEAADRAMFEAKESGKDRVGRAG
jgi:PleD family two-component response regulator